MFKHLSNYNAYVVDTIEGTTCMIGGAAKVRLVHEYREAPSLMPIQSLKGRLDTVPHHLPNKRLAPFHFGIHQ